MDQEHDRSLAERFARHADERAFRELYQRHTPALFALAVRLAGGRRDQAADLVQDAWLRAARALPSFRWESALRTWLSRCVINCWHESRRRAAREPRDDADVSIARPGPDPAGRIDLERAIAALGDGSREVLVLHDIHGYTHGEIAALLGIEPGTSKSQLSRARSRLRELLASRTRAAGTRR
jgi:RNA polymerase sigma-70 factor (ECF subfamily)